MGTVASLRDIENDLIRQAMDDETFAEQLKANPKETLEDAIRAKVSGFSLPANLQVKVLEETPDTIYLVLPQKMAAPGDGELTPEQLQLVSGGGYSDEVNTVCAASSFVGEPSWC